jgi:hypothetical protein
VVRGPLGVRYAYSAGPRLFRKLNDFSQQISKVYIRKKAKSEIENFKRYVKVKEFEINRKKSFVIFFFVCLFVVYCFEVQIVEIA